MRYLKTIGLAVALLASAALTPAKADTTASPAGVATTAIAFSGAAISGAALGKTIAGSVAFMLAYCQYHMKKDAAGKVVYQHPDCNGGGPVKVGSTTPNPYVPHTSTVKWAFGAPVYN